MHIRRKPYEAIPVKSRYPGLTPFKEDQQNIFFGREREVNELFNLVLSEATVVLFAKSGVGKSSLLKAGLYPKLKANGYYPINVRFSEAVDADSSEGSNNVEKPQSIFVRLFERFFKLADSPSNFSEESSVKLTPLQILVDILEKESADLQSPLKLDRGGILFDQNNPRLWELLKVTTIRDNAQAGRSMEEEIAHLSAVQAASKSVPAENPIAVSKLLPALSGQKEMIPVLVFDQFEEFFLRGYDERHEFLLQLSELLHTLTPNRISEWLRGINMSDRSREMINWSKPPLVKCIFAIRDDKLSEMDQMRSYIPLILRSRYKLSSLNNRNAGRAIEMPAGEKGDFSVLPFSFTDGIIDQISYRLSGNKSKVSGIQQVSLKETTEYSPSTEFAPSGIDGSQLQKVCTYIEKKVLNSGGATNNVIVDLKLINPVTEIQQILDTYYEEQLKTLGSDGNILACRNIIENHLVAGHARASITENQMLQLLKDKSYFFVKKRKESLIYSMISARLIKEEFTHLGKTYELSHDTLVNSVEKYATENKVTRLTRQRFFYIILSALVFLFFLATALLAYRIYDASNETNLRLADSYYQQGNHFLAFNIWDDYAGRYFIRSQKRKEVRGLLDSLSFFDVGGGDRMEFINDSMIAVHEKNNTIIIWKLNHNNDSVDTIKSFYDAFNMEISESRRFLAYRSKSGDLMVYDIKTDTSATIEDARLEIVKSKMNPEVNESGEFNMNFLRGSDYLGYVSTSGSLFVFDLQRRRRIALRVNQIENQPYNSWYIVENLKVSPDLGYLAIFKADSVGVWNISNPVAPRKVWTEKGVNNVFFLGSATGLCYLKQDSLYFRSFMPNAKKDGAISSVKSELHKVSLSPDYDAIQFYDGEGRLTIYNAALGKIITSIRDASFNKNAVNPNRVYRSHWLSRNTLQFTDTNRHELKFINISNGTISDYPDKSDLLSQSPYYTCSIDSVGILLVEDSLTKRVVYRDTLIGRSMLQKGWLNSDFNAGYIFDSTKKKVAFIKVNDKSQYYLKVVDLALQKTLLEVKDAYEMSLVLDRIIPVTDVKNNKGIYFLNGKIRNYEYYRKLYPRLTRSQKKRLGITVF